MKGKMVRIGTSLEAKNTVYGLKKLCGTKPALIVLGNEEHGISNDVRENCDALVLIPYAGLQQGLKESPVESLNVAQAASIILYELARDYK